MLGFLRRLFNPKPPQRDGDADFSPSDVQRIAECAQSFVDVINESLAIANESKELETRVSRLSVAQTKLDELKELVRKFPFLRLTRLDEVELSIAQLTFLIDNERFGRLAQGNQEGQRLESNGMIDAAIEQYEKLADDGADTPYTYRRLAILYRKRKQPEDEIRVLKLALVHIPKSNPIHREWFKQRLQKLKGK